MKCAVTGATGFIGAELCRQLHARQVETVVASRALIPAAHLAGVHTLFHCAGIAHREASQDAHQEANHKAVLEQARAASAAGVRQFVFLSTAKAGPQGDAYGQAKWHAEEGLAALAGTARMSVVALRPVLVYGVGVKGNLRQLMKAVRVGMPTPPSLGERSLVSLADVCAVMCRLLEAPMQGYHRFHVTDGERYHLQRIHAAFRRALGRPPGPAWLPTPVWRLGFCLLDLLSTRKGTWQKLSSREVYASQDLAQALDWQPSETLEGLATPMMAALDG